MFESVQTTVKCVCLCCEWEHSLGNHTFLTCTANQTREIWYRETRKIVKIYKLKTTENAKPPFKREFRKIMNSKGIFIQLGFSWGLNCLWFFILFERFKTFSFLNEKTLMLYWSFCPTFNLPLWRNWNSLQFLHRGKSKNGSTTTNCSVRN